MTSFNSFNRTAAPPRQTPQPVQTQPCDSFSLRRRMLWAVALYAASVAAFAVVYEVLHFFLFELLRR